MRLALDPRRMIQCLKCRLNRGRSIDAKRVSRFLDGLSFSVTLLFFAKKASFSSFRSWLLNASFMAANNLILSTVWVVLFSKGSSIGGWTLDDMFLLFGLSACSFGVMEILFAAYDQLPSLITSGQINQFLLRPRPTLLLILTSKVNASAWGDLASGIFLVSFSGALSWQEWILFPLLVILATAIYISAMVIFFSSAFWFERSENFARVLWEAMLTFSLYPEGIFPFAVRAITYTVLPSAFLVYVPVRILKEGMQSFWWLGLMTAVAIFWIWLALWVFKRGMRRYVARG